MSRKAVSPGSLFPGQVGLSLFLQELKGKLLPFLPLKEILVLSLDGGKVTAIWGSCQEPEPLLQEEWWLKEVREATKGREVTWYSPEDPSKPSSQTEDRSPLLSDSWRICSPLFPPGKPEYLVVLLIQETGSLSSHFDHLLELILLPLRVALTGGEPPAPEEERGRVLSLLQRVVRILNTITDLPGILHVVAQAVRETVPCDLCSIFLCDQKERQLEVAGLSLKEPLPFLWKGRQIPQDDCLASESVALRLPLLVDDLTLDPLPPFDEELKSAGLRSAYFFPVMDGQRCQGVLAIYSRAAGRPSSLLQDTLLEVASALAIALRNVLLRSELEGIHQELRSVQERMISQEKMKVLGEMACALAHDFNNSLAVVLGNIEQLRKRVDLKDPHSLDYLKGLELIETAAKDGAHMVKRLQSFGRRRTKEDPLELLDLNQTLQEVISLTRVRWRDEANRSGVAYTIDTSLHPTPLQALGAATELREAFTNLVVNAIDAMPRGGTLLIQTSKVSDHALVIVQDTGVGIPTDVQRRLFEPFFTTKGSQGTGLGLSITYAIVQRLGGEISVESKPGEGSTFKVTLPLATGIPRRKADEEPPASKRLKILAVDDDEMILDLLVKGLRMEGHEVTPHNKGTEALAALGDTSYDLLLTDLGMPDITGLELAKKAREIAPGLKICLLTGWGDQFDPSQDPPKGIDLVLSKPFGIKDLARSILALTSRA